MGSIPLPALGVKTPEQPDLLAQYARIQQLKSMPLQQQALQQQVQSGQMDLKMKQREMDSQNALMESYSQSGGDLGKAFDTASKSGKVLPQDLFKLRQAQFQMKQQALELVKTQGAVAEQHAGMFSDAANAIKDAPPEARPAVYQQKLAQLQQAGVDISQAPPQYPGDQPFELMRLGLQSHKSAIDEVLKSAETQKNAAQANEATVNANLAPQKVANEQAYRATELKQGQQRIGIEGARLNLERQKASLDQLQSNATGDAFLATLPSGAQAQVKAAANGDIAIPPAGSRSPQAQALRSAVMQYDPTYTDARYKGKQDFKTKGDAQNIVQLATAMEHADHAIANSAKVGFAPALGNKTLEAPESAAYMQDAEFLTGEVGKLVKNGVLTVDESNKIQSGLTSARQSVRNAALNETMDLLGGKVRGVFQKYKTATGQDLPLNQFFDAKSQQRLQKYGIVEAPSSSGSSPAAGPVTPQTHTFSLSAWQKANPNGDPNAAKAAAQAQGFQVIQ